MSHYKNKLTFGNIIIGLLLLGVIIVISLIALVYFELTQTPKRTAAQQAGTNPTMSVEAMSPDGRTITRPIPRRIDHQINASEAAAADAAASALNAEQETDPLDTSALTSGRRVQHRARPKRQHKEPQNQQHNTNEQTQQHNPNNATKEVPLEPINVPHEHPVKPKSNNNRNNSGERELTPVKPKRNGKQSEAIDALF